jgi:hypothetical protein
MEFFNQSVCTMNFFDMPGFFQSLSNTSTKAGAAVVATYFSAMGTCMGLNTSAACAASKYPLNFSTSAGDSSSPVMMPSGKSPPASVPPAAAVPAPLNTTSTAPNTTASRSGIGANAAGCLSRLSRPALLAAALTAAVLF